MQRFSRFALTLDEQLESFLLCPIFKASPIFTEALDLGHHLGWQLLSLFDRSAVLGFRR
jgi:hypothetical protein